MPDEKPNVRTCDTCKGRKQLPQKDTNGNTVMVDCFPCRGTGRVVISTI